MGDRRIPQVGEVLCGAYRLDRVLGWGAVGIVFAAWHQALGRPCAVKLLHPNFVEHTDVRERFRREALSAFKLNHPNIIRIIDFREDHSGWPMMVMELLHGESLRQRLGRGALPLSATERLYVQLCDAMAAAHSHGIVHRDLKPENIFLARMSQPDGAEQEVVKVLDFGISKVTDHPEITAMHALLGSPSYMSPEQARGDARTVDPRADIFSMGALLFECLTGRKAFLAADPELKRQLILRGAIPSLREMAPELPEALDGVLRRACAVDPAARFQSAPELLAALQQALRPVLSLPEPTRRVAAPLRTPAPLPGMTRLRQPPANAIEDDATLASPPPPAQSSSAPATTILAAPPVQPPGPGAATRIAGPAPQTALSARSLVSRALDRLGRGLGRHTRAAQLLGHAREVLRGREILIIVPVIFLGVLLLVILLDMQDRPGPQPLQPTPRRLQVIDGLKDR